MHFIFLLSHFLAHYFVIIKLNTYRLGYEIKIIIDYIISGKKIILCMHNALWEFIESSKGHLILMLYIQEI